MLRLKVWNVLLMFIYNLAMKSHSNQQIGFSSKRQLKKAEPILETYAYQSIYFRFTEQSIFISQSNSINTHHQIILNNQQILEDFKRIVGDTHNKCKIKQVFPQQHTIYLLIQIGKDHFLAEIMIHQATFALKNIFSSVFKIEDTSLFEQLVQSTIVSYKFFPPLDKNNNDPVLIFAKNVEKDVYFLFRGKIMGEVLLFYEDAIRQKQNKNGITTHCLILYSQSQFSFIYGNGQRRVHKISKGLSQYSQKSDLVKLVHEQMRLKKQIKNGAYEYSLVSSCQTSISYYFLFVVNSINSRYILIRWIKDHDLYFIRQFFKYSIPNIFDNGNKTNICCLKQAENIIAMIIWQANQYYYVELMNSQKTKVRLLSINQPDLTFGLSINSLLCYDEDSYYEAAFDFNSNSIFKNKSQSSPLVSKKLDVSNTSSNTMAISKQQKSLSTKSNNQTNVNNNVPILELLRNPPKIQHPKEELSIFPPRPIIDYKGNNRLSSSVSKPANECLSQVDEEQQKQIMMSIQSPALAPPLPPLLPSPPSSFPSGNIFSHSNSPIINPFNIVSTHINSVFNNTNNTNSADLLSFNPSQTINTRPASSNEFISFGVPPPNKPAEQVVEPAIQVPSFNRGFSFGSDEKVNNIIKHPNIIKQPNIKIEGKRNMKKLSEVSKDIKKYQEVVKNQAEQIKQMRKNAEIFEQKGNWLGNLQKIKSNLQKNKIICFVPQKQSYQSILKDIKEDSEDFQIKFQIISNCINRKIQEFGLGQKRKSQKQSIEQIRNKNFQKMNRHLITFKLKIDKLKEEIIQIGATIKDYKQSAGNTAIKTRHTHRY